FELGWEALERETGETAPRDEVAESRDRLGLPRAVEGAQGDEPASALLHVERGETVDEDDERARGALWTRAFRLRPGQCDPVGIRGVGRSQHHRAGDALGHAVAEGAQAVDRARKGELRAAEAGHEVAAA